MRPYRIIRRNRIQFVEAHYPRAEVEAFVRLSHHCGNPVGRVQIEAAFDDPRPVAPAAAAQFEHAGPRFQPVEKGIEMTAGRLTEAQRIARCLRLIKSERGGIASTHRHSAISGCRYGG